MPDFVDESLISSIIKDMIKSKQRTEHKILESAKGSQQIRILDVLPKDSVWVWPEPTLDSSQLPETPASGDRMPHSVLHRHLLTWHTFTQTHPHTHKLKCKKCLKIIETESLSTNNHIGSKNNFSHGKRK